MSKPLSWLLDDHPKLRIEHPWLKPAIERLEAERDRHAFNCEQLRSSPLFQSGMEAAAEKYQPLVEACGRWLKKYDHPMPSYFVRAFAAAKQQTGKAGGRELAGPPDNCPLCGRPHDLILDEDGNVHVASPANNITHRDGGDAKDTT